jgi:pyrimidine deaminase RibD-like protein
MDYMARALHLASRALGTCSPNPAVGAVLVRDGTVVGEGATQPPGQAHAEVVALRAAGAQAHGATLYVTLEPCAHVGRTAPCTDAILAAGVADVHVAMIDPSPWVDGRGKAALEAAGVRVRLGSHEQEARRLNEAYLTWVLRGRPLVTALYALGLDGRPRRPADAPLGQKALAEIERLRARADMTVTSADALLVDDPQLSRLASSGVTSLIVECPPADLGGLLRGELLDRVIVFVTPTLSCGGGVSLSPGLASDAHPDPADALRLRSVTQERLGETVVITGELPGAASPLAGDPATTT